MGDRENVEADLLLTLQKGLPLAPRPLEKMGEPLGLSGRQVLDHLQDLLRRGIGRRFGAVFDSSSLGYQSALCAADVPEGDLDRVATLLAPHPGITHCYQREGHPTLWFTLTAAADAHAAELARLADVLAPCAVLHFPALRVFKIEAVFDGRAGHGANAERGPAREVRQPRQVSTAHFSERERDVVRRMQGTMPLTEDPFQTLATELGWDANDFVVLLARWKSAGILRRVGLVVRHQRVGFTANSMCVWSVPPDRIESAGQILARSARVSHCYERPPAPSFPFNLYAMVHARTREELLKAFAELSAEAGLGDGRMMFSVREFKKSSPQFFSEARSNPWVVADD